MSIWKLFSINKKEPKKSNILLLPRAITDKEQNEIFDYLDGKRFMSRYHAGQKKVKGKTGGER
jgi:hypothetical protein